MFRWICSDNFYNEMETMVIKLIKAHGKDLQEI